MASQVPQKPGTFTFLGVFAESENVSYLLPIFLPRCFHPDGSNEHTLALTKVNDGSVWFQAPGFTQFDFGLIPLRPELLIPNLTGTYQCTSPTLRASSTLYQLQVIGKEPRNIWSGLVFAMGFSFTLPSLLSVLHSQRKCEEKMKFAIRGRRAWFALFFFCTLGKSPLPCGRTCNLGVKFHCEFISFSFKRRQTPVKKEKKNLEPISSWLLKSCSAPQSMATNHFSANISASESLELSSLPVEESNSSSAAFAKRAPSAVCSTSSSASGDGLRRLMLTVFD